MKNRISFIVLLFLFNVCIYPQTNIENPDSLVAHHQIKVLFISSKVNVWPWSIFMFTECIKELERLTGKSVKVYIEPLTIHQFENNKEKLAYYSYLQNKYQNKADVILSRDYFPYFDTLATFFPEIPFFFASQITPLPAKSHKIPKNYFIRKVDLSPLKTVDAALEMLPLTNQIVVISGDSEFDKQLYEITYGQFNNKYNNCEINYWVGLSVKEIKLRLAAMPKNTIVLYLSYSSFNYFHFIPKEVLKELEEVSVAPIFGIANTYIGNGAVGGYMHSAEIDGIKTAQLINIWLNGGLLQTVTNDYDYGQYQFDWEQLKKFKLHRKKLPEGSILFFRPAQFLQRNPQLIYVIIGVTTLLFLGLLYLLRVTKIRKNAYKKLKASEQRNRQLMEYTGVGIGYFNHKGKVILFNRLAAKNMGGEPKDFVNKTFTDLFGADFGAVYKKRLTLAIKTGTPADYEDEVELPTGTRWFLTTYLRMPKTENEQYTVQVVSKDITEIKNKEKDLMNTLREQEIILENDPAFIIFKDTQNNIIKITQTVANMTGLPKDQIEGRPSKEIYPNMADTYYNDDLEVMKSKKPKRGIIEPLPSVDGEQKWLMTDKVPILNEKGMAEGVIVFSRDITELKKSQDKLIENEHNLMLQNKIAKAFIITDTDKVYQMVLDLLLKEFACEFGYFGYINNNGDLVCPTLTSRIWEDCAVENKNITFKKENWAGIWGESLKTRNNLFKNKGLETPAGHVALQNAMAACVIYNGNIIGHIVLANRSEGFNSKNLNLISGICDYISPLLNSKINESTYRTELITAKEKAEESDKLKSMFLNNLSHEIRTPLNGIIGFSQFLQEKDLSDENRMKFAKVVINSGTQLLHIIEDILEVSSLELKQITAKNEKFNLNGFLIELESVFQLKIKTKPLELILITELPDSESYIFSDRTKILKVLSNLLDNAIKFTPKGKICFGYKIKNNYIELFVDDTGVGISRENIDKVFERFVQEEAELSRVAGGLGIGLSIVKANAEAMGGKISLSSEKNIGTSFKISIPYKKVPTNKKTAKTVDANYITTLHNTPTVLIVDDEKVNSEYLLEILLSNFNNQINLLFAENGKEALEQCKKHGDIALVLMDIKMPIMDGLSAAKAIKEFRTDLPIIAQTAYVNPSERLLVFQSGCIDYLEKPIDKNQLVKKVVQYLS